MSLLPQEPNMPLQWYDTNYDSWECAKCGNYFIDPEDYPHLTAVPEGEENIAGIEPRLYWLNITEPICSDCAVKSGIPPLDEA